MYMYEHVIRQNMVCLIKLMFTSMSKTHFESWISFQNTTKDHATDRLCSFSRHPCKSNKVKFTPETLILTCIIYIIF